MKSVWKYIAGFSLAVVIIFAFFISPYGKTVLLKVNRAKWERQNISHYRFSITTHVGPHIEFPDTIMFIEVKNGYVISQTDENGQPLLLPEDQSLCCTMENLFNSVEENLKTAIKVSVKYDAIYGFPTYIHTIKDVRIAGTENEISFSLSNLEILP